jgi:hypothetical protein
VRATRSTGELLGLQYAANNLGSAYLRGRRREEALAALEEARKVSVETGGSVVTVAIFSNLAGAYYLSKEYDKGLSARPGSRAYRA